MIHTSGLLYMINVCAKVTGCGSYWFLQLYLRGQIFNSSVVILIFSHQPLSIHFTGKELNYLNDLYEVCEIKSGNTTCAVSE